MDSPAESALAPPDQQFHFEDNGEGENIVSDDAAVAEESSVADTSAVVAADDDDDTVTIDESFATETRVIVTSSGEQFSLSSAKAIDLLGEEFVAKLKAEPRYVRQPPPPEAQLSPPRSRIMLAVTSAESGVATTTSAMTQDATTGGSSNSSSLVYCNLNDLDLAESENGVGGVTEGYGFASLHSLAEASTAAQQQARRISFSYICVTWTRTVFGHTCALNVYQLKGTVSRDFLLQDFFMNHLPPSP
jgi:hypothetical protein